jgi:hypothetical protein
MSASNCDGDQLPFSLRLFPFYVTPKQHLARKREVQQGKVRPSTLNPLHPKAHLEHHRKRGPVIYPTRTKYSGYLRIAIFLRFWPEAFRSNTSPSSASSQSTAVTNNGVNYFLLVRLCTMSAPAEMVYCYVTSNADRSTNQGSPAPLNRQDSFTRESVIPPSGSTNGI